MSELTERDLTAIEARLFLMASAQIQGIGNTVYIGDQWIALPGAARTAEAIANAPSDIRALLAHVRKLEAELDDAQAKIEGMLGYYDELY